MLPQDEIHVFKAIDDNKSLGVGDRVPSLEPEPHAYCPDDLQSLVARNLDA